MEKVVDTSGNNNISHSDKKSSPITDLSRSLTKVHGTTGTAYREAYNSKMVSTVHNQENNPDRSASGIDGGGLGIGPTGKYGSEANEVVVGYVGNNTHDVFGSCGGGVVNDDGRFGTNSRPFHIFAYPADNSYRSSEMGLSFTHAQWNELERQAMIYKYMISSVPVPHNLLFPFSRNAVDSSASSVYTQKYPRNGSDAEPGRCKRTDGKKWRCSRDVAPHQKYCERHLSRGRPRSRKHVEAKSNIVGENHKKIRLRQNSSLPKSTNASQLPDAKNDATLNSFYNNAGTEFSILSGGGASSSYKTIHGDLGLMIGSEEHIAMNYGTEEQHLEESNVELSKLGHSLYGPNNESLLYDQGCAKQHHPLDAFSRSNLPIQSPLGFIDAWSVDNLNRNDNANTELEQYLSSPSHRNLSPPSLTLSMAMSLGNPSLGEDMTGKSQEGNCASYCDYQETEGCDMAWGPISRGGPLGEALQAGSIASSNPTSPYNSAPFTTVSSPSGVLHKALFLHSDNNSVCNSPTSEGGFWWVN